MVEKNTEYFASSEMSQRFDLIRHLIENSEIIPLVRGIAGMGKSQMAERVRQQAPANWSVCLLQASASLSPDQLFAHLARCTGKAINTQDLLLGLVGRFGSLRDQGIVPVILVDDAHLLPPTAMIALLRLFERHHRDAPLVSIVLFANEQIDLLLSTPQLQLMSTEAIQVIDLQPLKSDDATSFMHFLFQVEDLPASLQLDSSRLTKLYRATKGIPGPLREAILETISHSDRPQVSKVGLLGQHVRWIAPLSLLLVLILLFQDEFNQVFVKSAPTPESPAVDTEDSNTKREELLANNLPPRAVNPIVTQTDLEEKRFEPEEMTEVGGGILAHPAQAEPESKSVIDLASGEDEASQEESEEIPITEAQAPPLSVAEKEGVAVDPSIQQSSGIRPPVSPAKDEIPLPAAEEEPILRQTKDAHSEQALKVLNPIEPPDKGAWVKLRPPQHYTIQLLGVERLSSLQEFVIRHDLQSKVFYIQTLRNGRPWYPLFFGEFPDKLSAIQAQQELPSAIKRNGVWPRPFSELQKLLAK